jgi:hypothetical protein
MEIRFAPTGVQCGPLEGTGSLGLCMLQVWNPAHHHLAEHHQGMVAARVNIASSAQQVVQMHERLL